MDTLVFCFTSEGNYHEQLTRRGSHRMYTSAVVKGIPNPLRKPAGAVGIHLIIIFDMYSSIFLNFVRLSSINRIFVII